MFKPRIIFSLSIALAFAIQWSTVTQQAASLQTFKTARAFNLVPANDNSPGNARSIALGDFNGDGRRDIVTANYSSSTISVVLSNGDGSFGLPTRFSVGSFPRFVLAQDLNNDGKVDLAVVNSNKSPGISILLGNGAGGFGPATGFTAGSSPESIAIADLNNDGALDLVVANSGSNNLSILLGNGAGSFSPSATIGVGTLPLFVVTADFNGDQRPDIVVANSTSGNIHVLQNNGSGGFGAPLIIPVGLNPGALATCDCNKDNNTDIVVANNGSNNVSVLLGTGTGNFGSPVNFATGSAPSYVTVADFNGDGKVDLAVANHLSGDVSILNGDGLGGFSAGSLVNTAGSEGLASDDFDLDGKADLAAVNTNVPSVWIFRGNGDGSFLQAPIFPTGPQPFGSVAGDFNGDGKPDVATANFNDNTISILLGDGAGKLGAPTSFPVGAKPRSLATADFNKDGKVDLVVGNSNANSVSVLLGNGAGSFGGGSTVTIPGQGLAVATGDFNGDSKPDIAVVANSVTIPSSNITILLGDGAGTFGAPINIATFNNSTALATGDFNADGRSDIAAANGSRVSIILGNGGGTFSVSSSQIMMGNDGTPSQVSGLAVGDLNGDGRVDLAVGIAFNFSTLTGNGDGTFQSPVNFAEAGTPALVADLNNDGRNDVGLVSGTVNVLTNGAGSFTREDFVGGGQPFSLVAADFNLDGKLDLATSDNVKNSVYILLNGTSATQPPVVQLSAAAYAASENGTTGPTGPMATVTVTRTGDASVAASVQYSTSDTAAAQNCNVFNGKASSRCDYLITLGTLNFAVGETSKTVNIPITDDAYAEGNETFTFAISNPSNAFLGNTSSATITIADNDTATGVNPIDQVGFFVRQNYIDFLNRQPDQSGFDFWSNQINSCGANAACIEVQRINVSAAFFLSIEFAQTGYLVERFYKIAYGDATGTSTISSSHQLPVPVVRFSEFLKDTQRIGQGVVVLAPGWEQALENNKQAYAAEFSATSRFITAFPATMTPAQFVDRLNQNAGNVLAESERNTAINLFGGAADSSNATARAQALRQVAEDQDLYNAEFNRAFVLSEYFGYLRRNPNDTPEPTLDYTGYDFWLTKLNQFNGDYIAAEMVKAFISSDEYRKRFGP